MNILKYLHILHIFLCASFVGGTPEIVGRTMKRAAGRPVAQLGLLFERFCHDGEVQERTLEHSGFSSCGEACAPPSAALLLGRKLELQLRDTTPVTHMVTDIATV